MPTEVKLFVGRLPRTMDETSIMEMFAGYELGEVAVLREKDGSGKGCAFVKFKSLTAADTAIAQMNGQKVVDENLGPVQIKYATGEGERLGIPEEQFQPGEPAKLFVGSLPKTFAEADVSALFSTYGTVEEVHILKDAGTNQSKGCGFVKMPNKEQALAAIQALNSVHTCEGAPRPLEVKFATKKGGAAPAGQQDHGSRGFSNAPARHNWVEYFTTDGRPYYYNTQTCQTQWEKPVEMLTGGGPAPMQLSGGPTIIGGGMGGAGMAKEQTGPPGANIFVFHLPNDVMDAGLYQLFQSFGTILSAKVQIEKGTGRSKGFGFVSFSDVNAAAKAVAEMNGAACGTKFLKVHIKKGEEGYAAPSAAGTAAATTTTPAATQFGLSAALPGGVLMQGPGGVQYQMVMMPQQLAGQVAGQMGGVVMGGMPGMTGMPAAGGMMPGYGPMGTQPGMNQPRANPY